MQKFIKCAVYRETTWTIFQETHVIIQIWQYISKDSEPQNDADMSENDRKSQVDCCQWFNVVVILCK